MNLSTAAMMMRIYAERAFTPRPNPVILHGIQSILMIQ
jgi:hypothetical protein